MSDDTISALERCKLFEGLGQKELRAIAASAKPRSVETGEIIATQGESGVGFFVIVDGKARVEREGRVLAHLGAGSSFGEVALLDNRGNRRSASVIAETPIELLAWSSWMFLPLLEEHPRITLALATALARMLNDAYAAEEQRAAAPTTA
jgi:CRP/FNR family transcriptional regulator, cyclic AMP receptor protein